MDDMTAFERQVQRRVHRFVGPARPVDDLAIFDAVTAASRSERWGFTMFSAVKFVVAAAILALFGGLLLAGVLTNPQEGELTPAQEAGTLKVTGEVLFELAVPRSALPDEPTALEAGDWTLVAGTDVTGEEHTSQAYEPMRNRAFMVTSGSFLIEPTTEALLWRASGTTPEVTPAGEAVTLQPGEAIYLPAVRADEIDPERYLRLANPGAEDVTGLTFYVHEGSVHGEEFPGFPPGLRWKTWPGDLVELGPFATDWTTADEAHFRLTHYSADPGTTIDLIESSAAPATTTYMVESGALERIMNGPGGEFRSVWRSGSKHSIQAAEGVEQTLTVSGDDTASFLELVATPRSATSE